ncbi:SDR family NAD(P)-dependent oxidoreductase [Vibrio sp. S4M6]|uniref:SDR family NAD(P)-dependent oxidoreductase n=1 Tax=Vibrio sinus TaxID=2946865 RepID=UPI00202A8445|nr:SDR family NAD(P)-dependent oxidoreductase [Vibrio sinus]MCL9779894.1 SDR family NAD(P)-dependent oxidoreductase [Vibrio sinus]
MTNKLFDKYGPWALVVGGTSGIGLAIAEQLAKSGINLILAARNQDTLAQQATHFQSRYQIKVDTISVDLSKPNGYQDIIDKTNDYDIGLFIPSTALENNGRFTEIPVEKELNLLQVNVVSVYALTHHFATKMAQKKKGGILLVTSLSGIMPSPYFSNYAGSKSYVQNLGLSLSWEMKRYNVDVSILVPGPTSTPMLDGTGVDFSKTPMSIMSPKAVASIALKKLGRKVVIIPGMKNRMMAFMLKYVMSTNQAIKMNGKLMEKVANFLN